MVGGIRCQQPTGRRICASGARRRLAGGACDRRVPVRRRHRRGLSCPRQKNARKNCKTRATRLLLPVRAAHRGPRPRKREHIMNAIHPRKKSVIAAVGAAVAAAALPAFLFAGAGTAQAGTWVNTNTDALGVTVHVHSFGGSSGWCTYSASPIGPGIPVYGVPFYLQPGGTHDRGFRASSAGHDVDVEYHCPSAGTTARLNTSSTERPQDVGGVVVAPKCCDGHATRRCITIVSDISLTYRKRMGVSRRKKDSPERPHSHPPGWTGFGFGPEHRRAIHDQRRQARREFREHLRDHGTGQHGPVAPAFRAASASVPGPRRLRLRSARRLRLRRRSARPSWRRQAGASAAMSAPPS